MERNSGIGLGSFIVGAAIGVAVGLLIAPKPGKETRKMLKHKAEEAKELGTEWAGIAREKVEEARELGTEWAGKAREKAEEARELGTEWAGKAKEKVGQLRHGKNQEEEQPVV